MQGDTGSSRQLSDDRGSVDVFRLWAPSKKEGFWLLSLFFLQEAAEVWTPKEARLTGLEETAGSSPMPCRREFTFPKDPGGGSSLQPSHIPDQSFSPSPDVC